MSVRGRYRRQGMHAGYTAASKKAIVTMLLKNSISLESLVRVTIAFLEAAV